MKITRKTSTIAGSIAGAAVLAVALAACTGSGTSGGSQQESQQQSADTNSLEASQPIPHYNYSQIRQTAIDAETIAADGTQTTSFFFQMGDADPVFSCPSIGLPVPNTAQLSNPDQVVKTGDGQGGSNMTTTGQMDPDGIYSPSASSGTYVICVNGSGSKYLMYWEGDVMSAAAGASWNSSAHSIEVTGAPTAAIHTSTSK